MFGFFRNSVKNAQLEEILQKIQMNMSNNYKDAAQENLKEFQDMFQCFSENQLNERQKAYYTEKLSVLTKQMEHYTHKDQKTTW